MEDVQEALDANDYSDMLGLVTEDESDDEADFPTAASPLPGLMAELQLAQEATPPASEVGSDFSFPSNAFRSADLPLLGEEAAVVPAQSLQRPGLYDVQHQLQSQRDTSDWQLPRDVCPCVTQYRPCRVGGTSDNEGRTALCPQFWSPDNSYASHTWAGQSIWCNPPFDEVGEVLQHEMLHGWTQKRPTHC